MKKYKRQHDNFFHASADIPRHTSCKRPKPGGRTVSTEIISYIPVVYVTEDAIEDMYILIDEAVGEIAWLGAVEKIGSDYLINKIYLIKQSVSAAHADLDNAAYAALVSEVLSGPGGTEEANKIAFWGHSHATMDVFTSGVDLQTIADSAAGGGDVFISGIFNKAGNALFTIALPHLGVTYKDVAWRIYNPTVPDDTVRRNKWKEAMKTCCETPSLHIQAGNYYNDLSPDQKPKTWGVGEVFWHGYDKDGREEWHCYACKQEVKERPKVEPPKDAIFEFVSVAGTDKVRLDWRRPRADEKEKPAIKWYTWRDGIQRMYPEENKPAELCETRRDSWDKDYHDMGGMH